MADLGGGGRDSLPFNLVVLVGPPWDSQEKVSLLLILGSLVAASTFLHLVLMKRPRSDCQHLPRYASPHSPDYPCCSRIKSSHCV